MYTGFEIALVETHDHTRPSSIMASANIDNLPAFSAAQKQRAGNALAHCIAMLKACDTPAQQKAMIETLRKDTPTRSITISAVKDFSAATQAVSCAHAKIEQKKSSTTMLEMLKSSVNCAISSVQKPRASDAFALCIIMLKACDMPSQQKALVETASKESQVRSRCTFTMNISARTPVAFSNSSHAVSFAEDKANPEESLQRSWKSVAATTKPITSVHLVSMNRMFEQKQSFAMLHATPTFCPFGALDVYTAKRRVEAKKLHLSSLSK
eukprot:3346655-Rhodomonas_salina.1